MNKRIKIEQPKEDTLIPNKEKTKEYPLDVLKELYIRTDFTIERMSQELRLPVARLERIARSGLNNWHRLKAEFQETRLEVLSADFDENLIEKQSIVQRLEKITLMEIAHRIAEIEAHYKKHGDFFARDVEDVIIRDGKGHAIRLLLPNTPRELLSLKGLEEAKITNVTLIQARLDSIQDKAKHSLETIVDVDSYGLFEGDEE